MIVQVGIIGFGYWGPNLARNFNSAPDVKLLKIADKNLQLSKELWGTIGWISKYYITPLGQVLKAAVPNTFLDTYIPKYVQFVQITEKGVQHLQSVKSHFPSQKRVLSALCKIHEPVKVSSLKKFVSSPYSVCKSLVSKGWVCILQQPKITDPFKIMAPGKSWEIVSTNTIFN